MGHQLPQRDRLVEGIGRLEIGQILRDRRVEIELALLDELHDGEIGEQLRDGADAINGVGRGRLLRLRIGEAEAPRPDDGLIVHQGDGQGRQPLGGNLCSMNASRARAVSA